MFFNHDKVALVSDNKEEWEKFRATFDTIGYECEFYVSDCWNKLIRKAEKYSAIMIDFKLGGGLLSVEIAQALIKNAFMGNIVLLASSSMEYSNNRWAAFLMKDYVLSNPESVINREEVSEAEFIVETVSMKRSLLNGGMK